MMMSVFRVANDFTGARVLYLQSQIFIAVTDSGDAISGKLGSVFFRSSMYIRKVSHLIGVSCFHASLHLSIRGVWG